MSKRTKIGKTSALSEEFIIDSDSDGVRQTEPSVQESLNSLKAKESKSKAEMAKAKSKSLTESIERGRKVTSAKKVVKKFSWSPDLSSDEEAQKDQRNGSDRKDRSKKTVKNTENPT
jgi:hypothetical protein